LLHFAAEIRVITITAGAYNRFSKTTMEDMDVIELSSGGDSCGTVIEEMETADCFFSMSIMGPPQPKPSPSFISWMRKWNFDAQSRQHCGSSNA